MLKRMIPQVLMTVLMAALVATLGACTSTTYAPITDQAYESNALQRKVEFKVFDALYDLVPDCVVVWPLPKTAKQDQALMIESAIARHFTGKVDRVIGPRVRDQRARDAALDVSDLKDRQSFARSQRCGFGVTASSAQADAQYWVVWSQDQVGLDLALSHTSSSTELWRARHIGRRGHGGLGLSAISIGLNMFEAGRSTTDGGQLPSVVDDALRRMLVTLPDLRF